MTTNPFGVYSWETWLRSLTDTQLKDLYTKWEAAVVRSQGHEQRVMTWDLIQLVKEIMRREESRTSAAAPKSPDTRIP